MEDKKENINKDKRDSLKKLVWVPPVLLAFSFPESVLAVASGWKDPNPDPTEPK